MSSSRVIDIVDELEGTLRSCWTGPLGSRQHVSLHEPEFVDADQEQLRLALESGFVSSVGKSTESFSEALASFFDVQAVVPVVNGTSALQLALYVSGVRPGDEVIVPALSFIATANAVALLGATPIFADSVHFEVDPRMGLSESSLEELVAGYHFDGALRNPTSGAVVKAIVPMHTLGRIGNMEMIRRFSEKYNLAVVEDAAESMGSHVNGKHPGSENVAITSFNGNKLITTGGGGAVISNNLSMANLARELSATARLSHPWRFSHSRIAWNFRMPALNAALGLGQMANVSRRLASKAELYSRYFTAFSNSYFFEILPEPVDQVSNHWLIPVALKSEFSGLLTEVLDGVNSRGIACRPMWDLLPLQEPYRSHKSSSLEGATVARSRIICLPSSPGLIE